MGQAIGLHPSTLHFLIWLGLLGVAPAAAALVLRDRAPRFPAALQLFAGPALFALVWVHGAVFNVPNNFAVLEAGSMRAYAPDGRLTYSSEGMSFFHFWFNPHRGFEYREHGALMAGLSLPIVVAVSLWLFAASRRWPTEPARPLRAAVGYLSWLLGALLLRHVTDLILDLAEHNHFALQSVGDVIDAAGTELALTFLVGAPPVALALLLARRPAALDPVRA